MSIKHQFLRDIIIKPQSYTKTCIRESLNNSEVKTDNTPVDEYYFICTKESIRC